MLQSLLRWDLVHYFDNFINIILYIERYSINKIALDYIQLTDCLGLLCNSSKDCYRTTVIVFELEVDLKNFILQLLQDKLNKAQHLTTTALQTDSITKHQARELASFLTFCAPAIQLRWVFMQELQSYVASFLAKSLWF